MGVTVCLPLFGAAGQELEEGQPLNGRQLRELVESLSERLLGVAELLDKLAEAGWSGHVGQFDVIFRPATAQTRPDAERQLRERGIDPERFVIFEDIED